MRSRLSDRLASCRKEEVCYRPRAAVEQVKGRREMRHYRLLIVGRFRQLTVAGVNYGWSASEVRRQPETKLMTINHRDAVDLNIKMTGPCRNIDEYSRRRIDWKETPVDVVDRCELLHRRAVDIAFEDVRQR